MKGFSIRVHVGNPPRKQNLHARKPRERSASRSSRESRAESRIPTLLKMGLEGGVVLKFHFKIPFLQSFFLNDQCSSSFHVIGKQVKIKYLRLAPEELSTKTEAAHV